MISGIHYLQRWYRELELEERELFMALHYSSSSNRLRLPGLYLGAAEHMAADTAMSVERVAAALERLIARGVAMHDVDTGLTVMRLPDVCQAPSNPSHLRSMYREWQGLPDCDAKVAYLRSMAWLMEAQLSDGAVSLVAEWDGSFAAEIEDAKRTPLWATLPDLQAGSPGAAWRERCRGAMAAAVGRAAPAPAPVPAAAAAAAADAELEQMLGQLDLAGDLDLDLAEIDMVLEAAARPGGMSAPAAAPAPSTPAAVAQVAAPAAICEQPVIVAVEPALVSCSPTPPEQLTERAAPIELPAEMIGGSLGGALQRAARAFDEAQKKGGPVARTTRHSQPVSYPSEPIVTIERPTSSLRLMTEPPPEASPIEDSVSPILERPSPKLASVPPGAFSGASGKQAELPIGPARKHPVDTLSAACPHPLSTSPSGPVLDPPLVRTGSTPAVSCAELPPAHARDSKPRAKRARGGRGRSEPLMCTVAELLNALAEASGGRVAATPFDARLGSPVTATIRAAMAAGVSMADIRLAGAWLQAGGLDYRDDLGPAWVAKTGQLLQAVASARRWDATGRPALGSNKRWGEPHRPISATYERLERARRAEAVQRGFDRMAQQAAAQ